ncbi:PREDICTED: microphthalmia-associated transcription factor-like isoform X3 [Branchiostoma belcheri]|uniref:Microphthalmia-associated transcription factor-like isoform X3 n=1 Tax=Branchiostoma belcheri TaxID=7741 RepID=A0A6P4ZJU1_BRABE|nr:PREDICTED: microphthalmia-associated transcription factor-like isoform X3 [Branchiostoma belcheri]
MILHTKRGRPNQDTVMVRLPLGVQVKEEPKEKLACCGGGDDPVSGSKTGTTLAANSLLADLLDGKKVDLFQHNTEKPTFKTATMSSRTALKMQLMREQMQEQERRDRIVQVQQSSAVKINASQASAINVPHSLPTTTEVPAQILKVETKLAHPTRYHIQQNQRRQVQEYLQSSTNTARSAPTGGGMTIQAASPTITVTQTTTASVPSPTKPPGDFPPDSPMSLLSGSGATGSEMDDVIDDIISLESSFDDSFNFLDTPIPQISSTMPLTSSLLDGFGTVGSLTPMVTANTSASCPADLTNIKKEPVQMSESELKALAKDRQKKDNHNMIERRRRFNINDRIKELGTLLPKTADPDMRWNKGTILKASVDYIRRLKKEHERMRHMEERQKQMEQMNRKMLLRIQELEMHCRAHSIPTTPLTNDTSTSQITEQFMRHEGLLLAEGGGAVSPSEAPAPAITITLEDMMDEGPAGDPMLSATVSPDGSRRSSINSMEDHPDLLQLQ